MNYLAITDLYGNSIVSDNSSPFILLHMEDPNIILEEVDTFVCNQHGSFWKFNSKNIPYVLNKFGLDSSRFAPLGHMWFPVEHLRGRVVLLLANINKAVSAYPVDYVKLEQFGKGYIWKPISPKGYEGMGYIYSLYKPSVKQMRVIANEHMIKKTIKGKSFKKNTIMNEYNYLGLVDSPSFTLKRSRDIPAHTIQGEERSYKRNKLNNGYNWDIDNDVRSTGTDLDTDSWITPKGKFVVLVEPDEPWFIKKSREEEKKRSPIQLQNKLGKIIGIEHANKPRQSYKSKVRMNYKVPHLGYGHSYKSRSKIKRCDCDELDEDEDAYENFDGEKESFFSKTINIIMLCLFITILTILICRLYLELKA